MNDMLLGFTVDSVTEIARINDEEIVDTPQPLKISNTDSFSGVGKLRKLILLLDLKKVLTPDEEQQVQELVEQNLAQVIGEATEPSCAFDTGSARTDSIPSCRFL